jgi:hypothetical protein
VKSSDAPKSNSPEALLLDPVGDPRTELLCGRLKSVVSERDELGIAVVAVRVEFAL